LQILFGGDVSQCECFRNDKAPNNYLSRLFISNHPKPADGILAPCAGPEFRSWGNLGLDLALRNLVVNPAFGGTPPGKR